MLEFIPFKTETDYDEFSQLAFNPQVMEMNFGPRVYTPGSPGLFSGHVKYEPVPDPASGIL